MVSEMTNKSKTLNPTLICLSGSVVAMLCCLILLVLNGFTRAVPAMAGFVCWYITERMCSLHSHNQT